MIQCLSCNKEIVKTRKGDRKYCNNLCLGAHLRKQNIQDWLDEQKVPRRYVIKDWLTQQYGYKCSCCGLTEWNNKPITLWVDHIDGNATNNLPSNFRLICPNCDTQSDTFGAKNYGKGRKSRGLPQYG